MKDMRLYLLHIIDCIDAIEEFCGGNVELFLESRLVRDATIRNMHVLSESAMRLPQEMRDRFAEINWKEVRGFRNFVVHEYLQIDLLEIWGIIVNDLPQLREVSKILLEELGGVQ